MLTTLGLTLNEIAQDRRVAIPNISYRNMFFK